MTLSLTISSARQKPRQSFVNQPTQRRNFTIRKRHSTQIGLLYPARKSESSSCESCKTSRRQRRRRLLDARFLKHPLSGTVRLFLRVIQDRLPSGRSKICCRSRPSYFLLTLRTSSKLHNLLRNSKSGSSTPRPHIFSPRIIFLAQVLAWRSLLYSISPCHLLRRV